MSLDVFDVSGQKVLLVGAGRGIGKGIALAFAQAGADVAITGLTPTGVNQVAEEVRSMGQQCLPLTGDATTAGRRPRLTSQGGLEEIVHLLADREPVYRMTANFEVDTEGKTPEELVDEILGLLDVTPDAEGSA